MKFGAEETFDGRSDSHFHEPWNHLGGLVTKTAEPRPRVSDLKVWGRDEGLGFSQVPR